MVDAPPLEHDRTATQRKALICQIPPQDMITAAIAQPQAGNAAAQLAEGGEMAAKRTAPIEHQQWSGIGAERRMDRHHSVCMASHSPLWRGRPGCRGSGPFPGAPSGGNPGSAPLRSPPAMAGKLARGLAQKLARGLGREWAQEWSRALQPLLSLGLLLACIAAAPALAQAAGSGPAGADLPATAPAVRYRCGGDLLLARSENGAVDAVAIPNTSAGTPPGAFVVLEWRGISLQLPRTNNAGAPSYTDGRWWWSLENPDQPRFRLRRGAIEEFPCSREP